MKAMARKTADRYQSYGDFREAVLALRKPETSPATLWDRLRAGFVDLVVTGAIVWLVSVALAAWSGTVYSASSPHGLKVGFVVGLIVAVLATGVPEGLLGVTVGKWLVGIRVTALNGGLPGLMRGLARVAVFQTIDLLGVLAQILPQNLPLRAWLVFFTTFGLRALLLATVRRSNGWMMLQDLLSGTRVLAAAGGGGRAAPRAPRSAPRSAGAHGGGTSHTGPYAVTEPAAPGNDVLAGWDASMQRAVWIVPRDSGTPEVTQARRDLARLTRLRCGGRSPVARRKLGRGSKRRAGEARWHPRAARGVSWEVMRGWMLDLSGELVAAESGRHRWRRRPAAGALPGLRRVTGSWCRSRRTRRAVRWRCCSR